MSSNGCPYCGAPFNGGDYGSNEFECGTSWDGAGENETRCPKGKALLEQEQAAKKPSTTQQKCAVPEEEKTCPVCRGKSFFGEYQTIPCLTCGGTGTVAAATAEQLATPVRAPEPAPVVVPRVPKAQDATELQRLRAQDKWWRDSFKNLLDCAGKRQSLLDVIAGMQEGLPEPVIPEPDPFETEMERLNHVIEGLKRDAVIRDDAIRALATTYMQRTASALGVSEDERRGMIRGVQAAQACVTAVAGAAFPSDGARWVDEHGTIVTVMSVLVSDPFVWTDRGPIPFTVFLRTFKPYGERE